MGSGLGSSFKSAILDIQVTNLSAGGSTGVTVTLVDANNNNALYTQAVTVSFTSNCVAAGTATIDSSVSTSTGIANATYTAAGCSGSDTITATATIGSSTLTATGTLTVESASLGSLPFVEAAPTEIGLAGMGGVTSSKVTFQVLDTNGNPVPDVTVSYSLDITTGGVTISPASSKTGADGKAFTFVQAGTAHTVVHVSATAVNDGITIHGGSTGVTISTGIPTQGNFTLIVNPHNLEAGSVFLGDVQSAVTVALSDRYQNPVTEGTQVSFTTNGGGIDEHCVTATLNGTSQCDVTWIAKAPIPDPTHHAYDYQNHAHILAYTTGEEHFNDTNNDGIFDNGDTFLPFTGNPTALDYFYGVSNPAQDDIGDPYMDSNEDGVYDSNETFASPISVTTRRDPDGKWYGVSCGGLSSTATSVAAKDENGVTQTVQCGGTSFIIGKEECIVMGTSTLFVMDPSVVNAAIGNTAAPTDISATTPSINTYYVLDSNGDVPAAGTTITLTDNSITGADVAFPGGSKSITVPDLPGACAAAHGSIPSSGNTTPYKGYPITVIVTPVTGSTGISGSFSISMKTPVTQQDETGITVNIVP
jgi:hypothetical protein